MPKITLFGLPKRLANNPSVDTAYAHGDASREDQALDHYLRIPQQERTQSTWNNLGVAFDNLKMQGKAVAAYRRAKELGETLAMSNLGNKYLLSGFLENAQAECDEALAISDYHKNVGTLAARLKELPDEEEKTQTEVLEKAKPRAEFFRELGRSISKSDAIIDGEWQGPDCRFSVATVLNLCMAEGEYERDNSNALALALAAIPSPLKDISKYKVTMTGSFNGHMLKGVVHREKIGSQHTAAGLLSLGSGDSQFLAFLSEDLLTISVLENPASAWSRMYQLRKLRQVSSQTAIPV